MDQIGARSSIARTNVCPSIESVVSFYDIHETKIATAHDLNEKPSSAATASSIELLDRMIRTRKARPPMTRLFALVLGLILASSITNTSFGFVSSALACNSNNKKQNQRVSTTCSTGSTGTSISSKSSTSLSSSTTTTTSMSSYTSSYLSDIPMGPPDAILGIAQAFRASTDPRKVNVCVGAYRDSDGLPWVLPSVRAAEQVMIQENANKEYLPIEGDTAYVKKALSFAYGASAAVNDGSLATDSCLAGVQTLSGTGACRIGGEFLGRFLPTSAIYIPNPTWGNHWKIFKEAGLQTAGYRYYSRATNRLDMDGLLEDIRTAPDNSIILLHACAHNPTGCDPTLPEWEQIARVIQEKHHIAFFDSAYQGFASGDAEQDAQALRLFVEKGLPVMLAQSFAKNFGLYGERCGTFSVVCENAEQRDKVMSQLRLIIRPMYSNPPKHGSSIVRTVLSDEILTQQYYTECASMARRIGEMRTKLMETLKAVGSEHDWSHIASQIGMFAFTGMDSDMCDRLTSEYEIYLTRDGRISLAGLNEKNVEYVAKAIHDVTEGKSITSAE